MPLLEVSVIGPSDKNDFQSLPQRLNASLQESSLNWKDVTIVGYAQTGGSLRLQLNNNHVVSMPITSPNGKNTILKAIEEVCAGKPVPPAVNDLRLTTKATIRDPASTLLGSIDHFIDDAGYKPIERSPSPLAITDVSLFENEEHAVKYKAFYQRLEQWAENPKNGPRDQLQKASALIREAFELNASSLNLSGLELRSLDPVILSQLSSVEELDLSNNELAHFDFSLVKRLPKLKYLLLNDNRIAFIEEDINRTGIWIDTENNKPNELSKKAAWFAVLDTWASDPENGPLEQLKIAKARLIDAFNHQSSSLDLSNLNIKKLDPNLFSVFKDLTSINLENNQLETLSFKSFSHLKNLRWPKLDNNSIPDPFIVKFWQDSVKAWASDSHQVPTQHKTEILKRIFHVEKSKSSRLDLSGLGITKIDPKVFSLLAGITSLDLSNNDIEELDEETFNHPTKLTKLNLSNNWLENLPHEVFSQLGHLKKLNLEGNSLDKIHRRTFQYNKLLAWPGLENNPIVDTEEVDTLWEGLVKNWASDPDQVPPENQALILDRIKETIDGGGKRLNLSGLGIKRIDPKLFTFLPNLRVLDLSHNELSTLDERIFRSTTKLHTLKLNNNKIDTIRKLTFKGLSRLTTLELQNNQIVKLDKNIFRDLVKLRDLDLSQNRLSQLHSTSFKNLRFLKWPNLSGNNLTQRNKVAIWRQAVKSWATDSTQLPGKNSRLAEQRILFAARNDGARLDLSGLEITHLDPKIFAFLQHVNDLDITDNPLADKGYIETIDQLVSEWASDPDNVSEECRDDTVRKILLAFQNKSEELHLDNSNIAKLDPKIFVFLPHLKRLYLNDNRIESIDPHTFRYLSKLEFLDLNGNRIDHFDSGALKNLVKLHWPDLGENNLSEKQIIALWENTVIDWASNRDYVSPSNKQAVIDRIFHAFENDNHSLDLSELGISEFDPKVLAFLPGLKELDLSGNHIESLGAYTFLSTPNLQRINLNLNDLNSLDQDTFRGLEHLLYLDLNENNLVTLDSPIFEDLESLAFLDLSSNKLVRLDENVFRPLTQLAGLDISDNELTNPNFAVPESTEIIR